jgi:hypothetical protein
MAMPAPAPAQGVADCPEIEGGEGHPIELRIGGFVFKAHVRTDRADEDGTRVEGRLISCEREALIVDPDTANIPDHAGVASVLRLLNDFRVSFDLNLADETGCIRAGVDVTDAAGQRAATELDRPLALEICGLPRR